jgi:hypothetical protein
LKNILLFLFFLFSNLIGYSQDFTWWNNKHHWDGVTNWDRYIIMSPAYMGPNALPVPEIKYGLIPKNSSFELSVEEHYLKGDNTQNLFTNLFYLISEGKLGLGINIVPFEFYKMDTITRDIRKSRDLDGKGFTDGGDLYVTTYIQIIKEKGKLPDLLLTLNLKTASGTNLGAARFTDTPGYFFDLSCGKSYTPSRFFNSIRPYIMAGFYSWQTNRDDYRQNDALLYGIGFNLELNKISLENMLGGYWGYINNGDKPLVQRLIIRSTFESVFNYKIQLQQGYNDFLYTSIRVGTEINLDLLRKRIKKSRS